MTEKILTTKNTHNYLIDSNFERGTINLYFSPKLEKSGSDDTENHELQIKNSNVVDCVIKARQTAINIYNCIPINNVLHLLFWKEPVDTCDSSDLYPKIQNQIGNPAIYKDDSCQTAIGGNEVIGPNTWYVKSSGQFSFTLLGIQIYTYLYIGQGGYTYTYTPLELCKEIDINALEWDLVKVKYISLSSNMCGFFRDSNCADIISNGYSISINYRNAKIYFKCENIDPSVKFNAFMDYTYGSSTEVYGSDRIIFNAC